MKKIFISLLALACLVACTPKKTAYEQYIDMYNDLEAQLETVEDRAAKDLLIEGFITDGYTLLMENIEDLTSDSIVLSHFYMLTPEQKAELFAAIPAERLEGEILAPVHEEYLIELKKTAYEQYIDMYDALVAQLETVEDRAVKDSLIEGFITDGYTLLIENIEDVTSDSIVLSHFYMLTPEQKAELIAAIPAERLEGEILAPVHEEYLIELKTSAGNPYIEITSLKADGTALALSELIGKTDYVLVDFWASWCGPCRRLMPALKELYESYHLSGKLEILGVSCDRDEAAWLQAIKEDELPWLHIRDQRTEPYNPCDKYGISAIPTTILINKEGVIVGRNLNEAEIEEILSK
ncbi:MAG: TlpA family protein disulfide reductase [Paludibacteraceae bacterium]|nr:TlpA family protein disulfide reductase [Paludibacteraceae bacterium]